MEIYLDSANIEEIKIANDEWGIISGVTTNPTLIAKEGKDYEDAIREILDIVDCHISVETMSTDAKGMVEDAKRFSEISGDLVTKIPMTSEGLKAIATINKIGDDDIRTNATLIFSANQALLASLAGADYISIFVGRLDDIGHSGMGVVKETVDILDHLDPGTIGDIESETNVIAASIRHPLHVTEAVKAGADIATVPFNILEKMIKHPLTDIGIEKFMRDYNKTISRSNG